MFSIEPGIVELVCIKACVLIIERGKSQEQFIPDQRSSNTNTISLLSIVTEVNFSKAIGRIRGLLRDDVDNATHGISSV